MVNSKFIEFQSSFKTCKTQHKTTWQTTNPWRLKIVQLPQLWFYLTGLDRNLPAQFFSARERGQVKHRYTRRFLDLIWQNLVNWASESRWHGQGIYSVWIVSRLVYTGCKVVQNMNRRNFRIQDWWIKYCFLSCLKFFGESCRRV